VRWSKNRPRPEAPRHLEIGVVYKVAGELRIAVPGGRFFSIRRGLVQVALPRAGAAVEIARRVTFDDLCLAWETTSERIDVELGKLMAPVIPVHPTPRGRHR
jgi:hypothetical protein